MNITCISFSNAPNIGAFADLKSEELWVFKQRYIRTSHGRLWIESFSIIYDEDVVGIDFYVHGDFPLVNYVDYKYQGPFKLITDRDVHTLIRHVRVIRSKSGFTSPWILMYGEFDDLIVTFWADDDLHSFIDYLNYFIEMTDNENSLDF